MLCCYNGKILFLFTMFTETRIKELERTKSHPNKQNM